jgi:hypothetical protein
MVNRFGLVGPRDRGELGGWAAWAPDGLAGFVENSAAERRPSHIVGNK